MYGRPFPALAPHRAWADTGPSPDLIRWLRDVGGRHRGTRIRFLSEPTPPSVVARMLARDEFTAHTGIEVEIEIVPLEQVLHKATIDARDQLDAYDLYYMDQSWTSLFARDTVDPRDLLAGKPTSPCPASTGTTSPHRWSRASRTTRTRSSGSRSTSRSSS
jgi:multiple sugar transport system substrate-binding protein